MTTPKRKIVQIVPDVIGADGNVATYWYAFCDDGTFWMLTPTHFGDDKWVKVNLPEIPGDDLGGEDEVS